MKYALVDGQRQEAKPGYSGLCQFCNNPMVARCGDIKVHHWAHRAYSKCDPWWEKETEWHRSWKNEFPVQWQEVIHQTGDGLRHIADVRTDQGWVLEFQHSQIHSDERKSREAFYKKLVWIVDGARRKRDKSQFYKSIQQARLVIEDYNLRQITYTDECALLRDWVGSGVPVLFDFSGCDQPDDTQLWFLVQSEDKMTYCHPILREVFIKSHNIAVNDNTLSFSSLFSELNEIIGKFSYLRKSGIYNPRSLAQRMRERTYQERFKSKGPRF